MKRRLLCLCLTLCLTLGCLPASAAFDDFQDTAGHWATDYLRLAYKDGLLQGYDDGTMRPDTDITGAQMVTILSRILDAETQADISAWLSPEIWYYADAARAVAMGLISTEEVTGLDAPMTRQRALLILAEAFQLCRSEADRSVLDSYSDTKTLSSKEQLVWANLIQAGYVNGWDGTLMLTNNIRRAEFVALLYRIANRYLEAKDYTSGTGGTVLSGDLHLSSPFTENLWTTCSGTTLRLSNVQGGSLTLRNEYLSSISLRNTSLDTLVLATGSGDVSLGSSLTANTLVVGTGSGQVSANGSYRILDIQGNNRNISSCAAAETIYITGHNNTVSLSASTLGRVVITGNGNTVTIHGTAQVVELGGKNNAIFGSGKAETLVLIGTTNHTELQAEITEDQRDLGIVGATAAITGFPSSLPAGEALTATVTFTDLPIGKTAQAVWYINGTAVSRTDFVTGDTPPRLTYNFKYQQDMALTAQVDFSLEYTTAEGEVQVVSAPTVTAALENYDATWYEKFSESAVLAKVTTGYRGNYTTQWAIDNDYSDEEKTIFVNAKDYASDTQYLIWVSIATQHVNIFQGSRDNWKLIRSGLIASGATTTPTPVGIWKTTYKQTGWYTSTYTVAPVVRFKGGGYAFHSRLYYPGTNRLSDATIGMPASHGCVRMMDEDIQWLYNNVPTNTTVVVF